ncbi:hypothetical protein L1281_002509 [Neisseria sp. HSC-16F19]|nr:hypothetical protein [Neisseria sp. HSC-16F19]MCP2041891.1 hypothetical protein [Neisseria sp. HSC-16F19]
MASWYPQHSWADYGIELWFENGSLFVSDPARASEPPPGFLLPLDFGCIRFEYRLTVKDRRIFQAAEWLPEGCQTQNQQALWSDVLGLRSEVL